MASATQAQSDDALRAEETRPEPTLGDLTIVDSSIHAFMHLEPEFYLDQAYAIMVLLEGSWRDAAKIGPSGQDLGAGYTEYGAAEETNSQVHAEAMAGLKTLVALAYHSCRVMSHKRDEFDRRGRVAK